MTTITKRGNSGFTLFELMVVVGITAILISLAVPSFTDTIKKNRLVSRANDIAAAFNLARQNAISRNSIVFVCHSNNVEAANPACNGGTSSTWSKGYLIYAPPVHSLVASNRAYNSATDTLIKKKKLGTGDSITVNVTDAASFVSFSSAGLLFGATGVPTLVLCDDRSGETGREIRLSTAGRFSIRDAVGGNACA